MARRDVDGGEDVAADRVSIVQRGELHQEDALPGRRAAGEFPGDCLGASGAKQVHRPLDLFARARILDGAPEGSADERLLVAERGSRARTRELERGSIRARDAPLEVDGADGEGKRVEDLPL